MISMGNTIKFRWAVRALNPKNGSDKRAIDHLNAGIAYYPLSLPSDSQKYYVVGYKNFTGNLATGSDWASQWQAEKLDKLDERRYPSGRVS